MDHDTAQTTVGDAAALVGVSVRTLHHWESLGLLTARRTAAGYRSYSPQDLSRLRRIAFYRGLGVPLAQIGDLLREGTVDTAGALRRQRGELLAELARTRSAVAALDRAIEAVTAGAVLPPQQQTRIFGEDWNPDWTGQAAHQWGDSLQWRQYAERAADRSEEQWERLTRTTTEFEADLVAAFRAGVRPGTPAADDLAERHRRATSEHFDCTLAMQVCLARRAVEDPAFAAHHERLAPGLGPWWRDVVDARARAHGVDPATAGWE